ncbi:TetR family transcriptional regulator [Nocardia puris]|uniref:TetR family transcriptional regulator n=1 Tax=Nocardia puris TaxID=208602 RepID=A0A366DUX6_9NOCA|nr:TetR/AcrR family transcriptional regulator [Nocardia puris]MBF6210466.1 TetR family transcriptional regulator [Nocardia puris]MBF6367541.1 TetR family transcriptional regulator [Nocardia puris]MBF6457726.1 TetR family transcriptional regulator [Nocardia puris]RBO93892.1 TetR family transcriptional regulator [Nocardia puris]
MGTDDDVDLDGRRLRTRRSREALSRAAFDLLTERGLHAVAVEDIAERAGVTRRTFSRHFPSIEAAILGDIDQDVHQVNEALRRRPAHEPPLRAYRNAVHDWLTAEYGGARAPLLARRWALFQRFDREPALLADYQRIRAEGLRESVAVVAERLGVDPATDLRPATVVAACSGLIVAALQTWAAGEDPDALPALIEGFFDTLAGLAGEPEYEESAP